MIAILLVACRSQVCSDDPETLPVTGASSIEESTLDDVWQTFARASAPAELCLTKVEVWSVRDWRVEGRYRSVRRNIWVGQDEPEQMATALRHELCHAFDQQVLTGRVPGEDFTVDVRLAGSHPGKLPAREAFAWTCSLEPTLVPAYAAASCDDAAESGFAYVAEEVYPGLEAAPTIGVTRLEVGAPALAALPPIVAVEALVSTPGKLGVLLNLEGSDATELAWIDLDGAIVEREPPDAPLSLLTLAPEGSVPPTTPLALPYRTAASAHTEVAMVEVALLSGYARRLLVRRDGGAWGAAPDACGIELDERTSFFLLGENRSLTSVSAVADNQLVVIGWDEETR